MELKFLLCQNVNTHRFHLRVFTVKNQLVDCTARDLESERCRFFYTFEIDDEKARDLIAKSGLTAGEVADSIRWEKDEFIRIAVFDIADE